MPRFWMRGLRALFIPFLLPFVAACSSIWDPWLVYGPRPCDEPGGGCQVLPDSGDPDAIKPLPECTSQRAINIVAGTGGLGYFTLIWPVPRVIESFQPGYAYDDMTRVGQVAGTTAARPLYARKVNGVPLWESRGATKLVSVMFSGSSQAHTSSPTYFSASTYMPNGVGGRVQLFAAEAALQTSFLAPVPVVSFTYQGVSMPYGPATGAPSAMMFPDVSSMVSQMSGMFPNRPELAMELAPSPSKMDLWTQGRSVDSSIQTLSEQLLLGINAFKTGLSAQVIIPAFNNDPHSAFALNPPIPLVEQLARVMDLLMAELASTQEPSCTRNGARISMADNVVITVSGDTPKNPFQSAGWPDGTPSNSNWIYVMSNGYVKGGWFGKMSPTAKTNFDPRTGDDNAMTPDGEMTSGSLAAVLYAVARGDMRAITPYYIGPYEGLVTLP